MSEYFVLDPEVPGGLGDEAELVARPGTYPQVTRLHFEFGAGRADDDLFTTHPVYLVTAPLADSLRRADLTGFSLRRDVKVTVDENVRDLEPDWIPPVVEWLQVSGTPGVDDMGLTPDARLVVSGRALAVLQHHQLDACDIRPFTS